MARRTELVFIPFPGMSHLAAPMEVAKLLTHLDHRLSITIFIVKLPFESYDNPTTDSDSIRFVTLPTVEISSGETPASVFFTEFVKAHVPVVRDAVHELTRFDSVRLAGFVVDMFCTSMIDVADEFGVPSYLFFTSSAAFLGFMSHLQFLHDCKGLDLNEFKDSDATLEVPSYVHPVPGKVFPAVMFDKEGGGAEVMLSHTRRHRRVKGIMVNTFAELESHAIESFSADTTPPVYPIGPLLNTNQVGSGGITEDAGDIIRWLDDQPSSSVVFLCFGSMGAFGGDQMKEIAHGLEGSGHRFLWVIRQPPPKGKMGFPCNYANVEEVLTNGFLNRTIGIGQVIGWAPQVAILAHPAVGGFVSHCGWNSTLESIWFGVPVATWPMRAEQQVNAFQMIKDLGLSVEIKMDYYMDKGYVVSAKEIENGIRGLMNVDNEVRKKRETMRQLSRKAMSAGGSSYLSLQCLVEKMMANFV